MTSSTSAIGYENVYTDIAGANATLLDTNNGFVLTTTSPDTITDTLVTP